MVDAVIARDAPLTLESVNASNRSAVTRIGSNWLYQAEMRLDAGYYNPGTVAMHLQLESSGLAIKRLADVTERIFIPPRFKRIYVDHDHGIPFLQGTHLPQFKPTDIKYLSRSAHKNLGHWLIYPEWVLVTRSGTIGRVAITLREWSGWAASEHILRIVPQPDGPCPPGYIYAWLASPMGQVQFNGIYGSVVDEITAEHVANILLPVPETEEQQAIVNAVNDLVFQSLKAKEQALEIDAHSVNKLSELVSYQR